MASLVTVEAFDIVSVTLLSPLGRRPVGILWVEAAVLLAPL